jgi:hypothetical protein
LLAAAAVALALQPPPKVPSFLVAIDQPAAASPAALKTLPNEASPPSALASQIVQAVSAFSFPELNPSLSSLASAHGPEWKICGNVSQANLAKCTFPAQGSGPAKTLVVLGDSFGIAWTPAMRAAQADGYTVIELTHSQCPAIDASFSEQVGNSSAFTSECNAARNWYVSQVARLKPDIVVIGNYDAMLNNLSSHAKGRDAINEWAAGAQKIITRVKQAGAKRVVWLSSPPPSGDLAQCDQNAAATPSQCVRTIGDTWLQVLAAETAVAKAQDVTMLDTRLFFCTPTGYCPAYVGTTPVHTDGHHLTGAYAKSIGPDLMPYVIGTKTTE